MKTVLLDTQRLIRYFEIHCQELGWQRDDECFYGDGFKFQPLFSPDSNVICFQVVPLDANRELKFYSDKETNSQHLRRINILNELLYNKLKLNGTESKQQDVLHQAFFASHTKITAKVYTAKGDLDEFPVNILKKVGWAKHEFGTIDEGIFVLRCTLMNPWYYNALRDGKFQSTHNVDNVKIDPKDYLWEFVEYMNEKVRAITTKDIEDYILEKKKKNESASTS